jgi:DNA-binding IclR family transcriptional regulator
VTAPETPGPAKPGRDDRLAVKSADRVLDLLELLAGPRREMTHTEIALALSIPKSSLSQLLATLQARGWLDFSHETRSWRLGATLPRLARAQAGAPDLPRLAMPVLQALTQACQESSALNLLAGDEAVVVATAMGPMRLVSHMREGDRAPLYATSGGKAILTLLEPAEHDAYLARTRFRRITPHTLSSAAALRRALAAVRRDGVAHSMEEFTPGIVGIAVPLPRQLTGTPAAINVALPAVRFDVATGQRIRRLLDDAAARLSQALRP